MRPPAPVTSPALRRFVLQQSRLGMFTRCLILLAVLGILGSLCFTWYRDRFLTQLRDLTDATAAIQPMRLSIEGDMRLFKKRWRDFSTAKPADEPVLDLTEDDLRSLLRSKTSLADRAEVRLTREHVAIAFTLPLGEVPFLSERFAGRYLNLSATMTPILTDGIARVAISQAASGGKNLPEERRKLLELACSAWLYNALVPHRDVLARVKQIRIDNGVMYLRQ